MSTSSMKIIVALVAVVLVGAGVGILLTGGDSEAYDGPVDALGNTTSFSSVPEKIISTAPSITEILLEMGYIDNLVAVSNNCDQPEIVSLLADEKIKAVGSYNNPSAENIMALEADVVFMGLYSRDNSGTYENLRTAGLKVIMLHGGESFSEIYLNLNLVGDVLDNRAKSNSVMQYMINTFNEIETLVATAENTPKAMINLGFSWGLSSVYGACTGTFGHDMIVLANGENVLGLPTLSGWKQVSKEILLDSATSPEVIIVLVQGGAVIDEDAYETQMTALKADATHAWSSTPAVDNDRVYFLFGKAGSAGQRTSPNLADFAKLVTMIVHPELFDGVDVPYFLGDDYKEFLAENW